MAKGKITLAAIEALAPGQSLWDTVVQGFGVRRQRKAAVYVLKDRKAGRQRFITIGTHCKPWTPASARERAKVLAGSQTAAAPDGLSFGALADLYVSRHSLLHKKERSQAEDRRNLDLHILPAIGHLPISDVTREVIARFHASRSRFPANANRCLALISHIFTMAERWGYTPPGSNPCRGLPRYREKQRERYLNTDELGRLGRVLGSQAGETDWRALGTIRLLLFTGARLNEILTLKWQFIDWEASFARLPDGKVGARTLALPAPALDLLRSIQAAQAPVSGYVFSGKRPGTYYTTIQKSWQKLRHQAGLDDVRIHDLRHTFGSTAASNGESLYLIGKAMGHKRATTTQRYAHIAPHPMLETASRTAGHLLALMESAP